MADQLSKAWIVHAVPLGGGAAVLPFFNVMHTKNTGAAFSFLADAGGWQRYFFMALALTVSLWISLMLLRGTMHRGESLGYSLILGGAMGNAVDRGIHGAVTDFLDLHAFGWHWPAFNLADMAITGGAALLIRSGIVGSIRQPNH